MDTRWLDYAAALKGAPEEDVGSWAVACRWTGGGPHCLAGGAVAAGTAGGHGPPALQGALWAGAGRGWAAAAPGERGPFSGFPPPPPPSSPPSPPLSLSRPVAAAAAAAASRGREPSGGRRGARAPPSRRPPQAPGRLGGRPPRPPARASVRPPPRARPGADARRRRRAPPPARAARAPPPPAPAAPRPAPRRRPWRPAAPPGPARHARPGRGQSGPGLRRGEQPEEPRVLGLRSPRPELGVKPPPAAPSREPHPAGRSASGLAGRPGPGRTCPRLPLSARPCPALGSAAGGEKRGVRGGDRPSSSHFGVLTGWEVHGCPLELLKSLPFSLF